MKSFILAAAMACAAAGAMTPRAAAQTGAAETHEDYAKKARAALDELGGRIDALEARAKAASGSARADSRRKVNALKARRKAVNRDLSRLERASGKAWSDLKAGIDRSLRDLRAGIDAAVKD